MGSYAAVYKDEECNIHVMDLHLPRVYLLGGMVDLLKEINCKPLKETSQFQRKEFSKFDTMTLPFDSSASENELVANIDDIVEHYEFIVRWGYAIMYFPNYYLGIEY